MVVNPPPSECCSAGGSWTSDDVCNPLQKAVDDAAEYTQINIMPGTYCNKNFYKNVGLGPANGFASSKSLRNSALLKIDGKNYIKLVGVDANGNEFNGEIPRE